MQVRLVIKIGSIPAGPGNTLSWKLILKYFIRHSLPFCFVAETSVEAKIVIMTDR